MNVHSVEFIGAIGQVGQAPPETSVGLPQVAFAGRSNVGKSTLINHLLGRTRTPIARVSQQPGKTQEINFYQVRADLGEFCLVDLPGYGYAKVPAALRDRWRPLIEGYMSAGLMAGVVQLIDIRHGPTPDDLRAIEYLAEIGVPALFALTKADKLKPTRRRVAVEEIAAALNAEPDQVVAVSSLSGDGMEDLRETVGSLLFAG